MKTETKKMNFFILQAQRFEESRFAAMAILITLQSCLASIAAMFSLQTENTVFLSLAAMTTMGSNALFIAQASAKACIIAFYLCILVNGLIILTNL